MELPQRMWINQPSKLQPYHDLHGTNVLVVHRPHTCLVYFLRGNIVSQYVDPLALSDGWKEDIPIVSENKLRGQLEDLGFDPSSRDVIVGVLGFLESEEGDKDCQVIIDYLKGRQEAKRQTVL